MRQRDLTFGILQKIASRAVQHAGRSAGKSRGMLTKTRAVAAGFHSDEPYGLVANKGVEHADGVAATAHAGKKRIRQATFTLHDFGARFLADHTMKVANHHRIGVSA